MSRRTPYRLLPAVLCLGSTALLALSAAAISLLHPDARSAPPPQTPLQVACLLDSLVQPRFQQNAGQFGVDRVVVGGHDAVYDLAANSPAEKRKLRQVKNARHPFVVAFLHCAHKPGRDKFAGRPGKADPTFRPYVSTLVVATETAGGGEKIVRWADDHLEKSVLPHLPVLRTGAGAQTVSGNWLVVMRPVRASRESCLGCHAGARRGDTLGVMVYAVAKTASSHP